MSRKILFAGMAAVALLAGSTASADVVKLRNWYVQGGKATDVGVSVQVVSGARTDELPLSRVSLIDRSCSTGCKAPDDEAAWKKATAELSAKGFVARDGKWILKEEADALDRRVRVAIEGRMSSHCVAGKSEISRPGDGTIVAVIEASRRLFIADKLSKDSTVTYRLVLEPCAPTVADPNALAAVAQGLEERHEARK